ncbi:unnamed protein product, partial [marine sediment metagenome]
SFDEWKSLMFTLNAMNESGGFWRGDLYLAGEQWFGENQASSIFDPTNWNVKTWQNNASVCRRIPTSLRREQLSYTHHAIVAYLDPEQMKHYLDVAEQQKLNTRELSGLIKSEDPSSTGVPPLKRLQKIENDLWELIDDVEGDVQKNIRRMHRICKDTIEMQRKA